ncbi:MAG TPA: hypothetical protein VKE23_11100 [Candidatus Limnocylindria bacterium]|nr:hypothetical protein [Candidatus Limnocylindria bacterium]
MRGRTARSAIRIGLAGVGWLMIAARCASAQNVPPVFIPFETANQQIFNGRFDRTVTGFFQFMDDGVLKGFGEGLFGGGTFSRVSRGFQEFQRQAQASTDEVPIPSGSVSVAYAYDPKLETFVREQRPFAPALSVNARTDGRGVLTVGAAFSYLQYQNFEGQDRDGVVFPTDLGITTDDGLPISDQLFFQFKLRQSIYSVSIQFGVLDNLDVGIFIPILDESFRGRIIDEFAVETPKGKFQPLTLSPDGRLVADSRFEARPITASSFNVFPGTIPSAGFFFSKNTWGVGDVILRTKAFLGSAGPLDFGGAVNLALPTGDEDDLLGVGSVRVDPRLLISTGNERFTLHTNQAVHLDVDDQDRDRYDYSVGGEAALTPWLTLLVDHVGRIEIFGNDKIRKFEIVPGIKANVYGDFIVGFNAIVPLNDSGLTTDFTPNATIEVSKAF